jgi:hypothetical protein
VLVETNTTGAAGNTPPPRGHLADTKARADACAQIKLVRVEKEKAAALQKLEKRLARKEKLERLEAAETLEEKERIRTATIQVRLESEAVTLLDAGGRAGAHTHRASIAAMQHGASDVTSAGYREKRERERVVVQWWSAS